MLTSVVEVNDLDGAREVLLGKIPDPHCAVANHYFFLGSTPTTPPSFVVQPQTKLLSGLDSSHVGSGLLLTHRAAVPVSGGLREHATQFDLAGVRRLALHFARPILGLGLYHRYTSAIHFDVEDRYGGSADLR